MTVSTTLNKIIYIGDGSTTTFTFTFAVPAGGSSDIEVFTTDTSGNITQLTPNTQYTVILNAASAPNPTPVGGSVTLNVAPANGVLVTILRSIAETQATSLANQGTLYQPVIEAMGDYITMLTQQIAELQGRAISVAVSDNAPSNLPPAAQRANLAMGFDASGNPIAFSTVPAGVISSAMAPFVGSSTLAAAKALLGYGSMANENIGAAGKGIIDDGAGNARVNHTISAVTTNQSPGSAQHATDYVASGSLIFTLPKLSTVFNGYELWVFCVSGTATLSPNASDNFPTLGGGVSVVLTAGQCARIIGDGVSAWQTFLSKIPGIGGQTRTVLTTGSGATYTTKAGCTKLSIRMCGGGGGGANSAGSGTATTFNSITANGGGGGGSNIGGSGGSGGAGSASFRTSGIQGGYGGLTTGGSGGNGFGGSSPLGSFGAGGAGGGTANPSLPGGGSGEYVEILINSPAATYIYTVGTGGTAGAGGVTGGAGVIIIDEFYN